MVLDSFQCRDFLLIPITVEQGPTVLSVLVGCFGFNGSLRQYFSLCRTVSERDGERGKKG